MFQVKSALTKRQQQSKTKAAKLKYRINIVTSKPENYFELFLTKFNNSLLETSAWTLVNLVLNDTEQREMLNLTVSAKDSILQLKHTIGLIPHFKYLF